LASQIIAFTNYYCAPTTAASSVNLLSQYGPVIGAVGAVAIAAVAMVPNLPLVTSSGAPQGKKYGTKYLESKKL
jgi:hypothetical protein